MHYSLHLLLFICFPLVFAILRFNPPSISATFQQSLFPRKLPWDIFPIARVKVQFVCTAGSRF